MLDDADQLAACTRWDNMHGLSRDRVVKFTNRLTYDDDLDSALEMCRWLLKPLGIWSLIYSNTNRTEKVLSIVLLVACFSGLLFIMVPLTCHLFLDDVNQKIKIKMLGPASNCMLSMIKYFYLVLRRKTFARCIQHMENDWKIEMNRPYRAIMLKQATFSRNLVMLCIVFVYFGGLSFHVMLPLSKRRVIGNVTLKTLAYPGYDRFFDVNSSPSYEILYCIQCFAGFVRHNVTTAAFSLVVVFVTHICGQIQIQISRLEELNRQIEKKDFDRDPLAAVVREHTEILRFAKTIGDAFGEIFFMEIIGATFLMCLVEYCCLTEWMDSNAVAITTYVVYMISFTFNALIFCYIGEILTEQIGLASYEVSWYNLPAKKASSFVLLNAISLYPPRLNGGKVTVLSLNTFSMILKSSIVYLNMLRAVTAY